mmetsp:Transcript_56520/g.163935  ORF Transcript_56520/g.163935 Transcript_56520/m.163935 type:complete len:224 (-) Transcript_56520:911-1582(-)
MPQTTNNVDGRLLRGFSLPTPRFKCAASDAAFKASTRSAGVANVGSCWTIVVLAVTFVATRSTPGNFVKMLSMMGTSLGQQMPSTIMTVVAVGARVPRLASLNMGAGRATNWERRCDACSMAMSAQRLFAGEAKMPAWLARRRPSMMPSKLGRTWVSPCCKLCGDVGVPVSPSASLSPSRTRFKPALLPASKSPQAKEQLRFLHCRAVWHTLPTWYAWHSAPP